MSPQPEQPATALKIKRPIGTFERRCIPLAVWGLLAVLLSVIGYWRLFTQFMNYDDEGYVLWSLRSYCAQGGLYGHVFSQYGPFFYVLYHALHVLTGFAFDNVMARFLTLGYWCSASLLCGCFCWRHTRSVPAGLAAAALTFVSLITMIREPSHPGGLLALLAALGAVACATAIERNRPLSFMSMAFLCGTAMALTKINVGGFFLVAAGIWAALNTRTGLGTRVAGWSSALVVAAIPLLLMRTLWPEPWVMTYALVFMCSALTLTMAVYKAHTPEHGWLSWSIGLFSTVLLAAASILAVWARGTSWADLWQGVIAAPLRHPMVFAMPVWWPSGVQVLAILAPLIGSIYYSQQPREWLPPAMAVLRIVAGVWFLARVPVLFGDPTALQDFCFFFGPSLAWLMAVPLTPTRPTALGRARLWVAWVFIWQTLQAYPVAGSQVGWGSFLFVPLLIVGWNEALEFYAGRLRESWPAVRGSGVVLLLSAGAAALWPLAQTGYSRFSTREPLGLPGAERLRLGANLTKDLRSLNENIRSRTGRLFSYPGMFSFNIWTDCPPPTGANVTHWFSLLSEDQQRAIMAELDADPHATIVVNRGLIDLLVANGVTPRGILQRYVTEQFVPLIHVGEYELWSHRDR